MPKKTFKQTTEADGWTRHIETENTFPKWTKESAIISNPEEDSFIVSYISRSRRIAKKTPAFTLEEAKEWAENRLQGLPEEPEDDGTQELFDLLAAGSKERKRLTRPLKLTLIRRK